MCLRLVYIRAQQGQSLCAVLSSASNSAMRGDCSAASEEPSSATAAQQESEDPGSSSSGGEDASSAGPPQRARLHRQAAPREPLIYPSESEPEGARQHRPPSGTQQYPARNVNLHKVLKLKRLLLFGSPGDSEDHSAFSK